MTQESFSSKIPEGEDRPRRVCDTCGFIDYVNPKIVAGSVVAHGGQILLCKRAIEPRKGYWTLPAGFMEERETVEEAAKREAHEEALADIEIDALLAVYSIPRISQVQIMFKARLAGESVAAGPESEAVAFYDWDDIPWPDLAFPSVHWALKHYDQVKDQAAFVPFGNPDGVEAMVR